MINSVNSKQFIITGYEMLGMKHGKYELIYIYILKEAFEYENFYLN